MAENELMQRLNHDIDAAGLTRKVSYTSREVKAILGLSNGTYFRMIHRYSVDTVTGEVKDPLSLKAYQDKGWRVSYHEMAAFLARKLSLELRTDAPLVMSPPVDTNDFETATAPCPHCDGREVTPVSSQGGAHCSFRCQGCGATGPSRENWNDAIAGWNRRVYS